MDGGGRELKSSKRNFRTRGAAWDAWDDADKSRSAFPSNSGRFAVLTAIRRASSVVSTFAWHLGLALPRIDVGERPPVGVPDDIAARDLVETPRGREAADVIEAAPAVGSTASISLA